MYVKEFWYIRVILQFCYAWLAHGLNVYINEQRPLLLKFFLSWEKKAPISGKQKQPLYGNLCS